MIEQKTKVNIKVLIPVTKGGYTGQRDQWEQHETDHIVTVEDGTVTLEGPSKSKITFARRDLDEALRILAAQQPVLRNIAHQGVVPGQTDRT